MNGKTKMDFMERYSEFRNFMEKYSLEKAFPKEAPNLQLPKKKLLGKMKTEIIESRTEQLDTYIKSITSLKEISSSEIFLQFLSYTKPLPGEFIKVETKGQGPSPRTNAFIFFYSNSIYIYSGFDNKNRELNDFYNFNLNSKAWKKLDLVGEKIKEKIDFMIAHDNKLFLIPNFYSETVIVDMVDLTNKYITKIRTEGSIERRTFGSLIAVENIGFIFGGRSIVRNKDLGNLDILNLETLKFEKIKLENSFDNLEAPNAQLARVSLSGNLDEDQGVIDWNKNLHSTPQNYPKKHKKNFQNDFIILTTKSKSIYNKSRSSNKSNSRLENQENSNDSLSYETLFFYFHYKDRKYYPIVPKEEIQFQQPPSFIRVRDSLYFFGGIKPGNIFSNELWSFKFD
ncbi:hypothetical protein M0811_13273 [Anaeramoeba ignava]|uniref:PX domain-containing protein n=1 Tax=Anaeramoeba ignava TaxID=1746090 RepID=A0A9Q0R5C9_ANAIG|nr:hypothetical protein M0811_13273 [Anaeramoeba ignava]